MSRGNSASQVREAGRDRELLGWITPKGEGLQDLDLLSGTGGATGWLRAKEYRGIAASPIDIESYGIEANVRFRVRLLRVSTAGIAVKEDDFGDATAHLPGHVLSFPAGVRLTPIGEAPCEVHSSMNPRI